MEVDSPVSNMDTTDMVVGYPRMLYASGSTLCLMDDVAKRFNW